MQNPSLPNSETNPYLINSAADWGKLVYDVNIDYYSYTGKYIKLNTDIVIEGVEYMVGTDDSGFSGTFDGSYHTLTINYNGTFGIAPFYDTTKATIQDLIVEGDITAYSGEAAGLIYKNFEATTISNVTVSVNITATNQHKCAGFAVFNDDFEEPGQLIFYNCVYNGTIIAGTSCGGFWTSTSQDQPCGTATFTNCLFDPAEGSVIEGGKTFGTGTDFSSCYYTDELGTTAQGTRVYKERPSDIVIPANINGVDVYMPVDVEITGVAQTYNANGTDYMSTIMACSIKFDGVTKLLSASSDKYDVAILKNGASVENIIACGDYTIRITGKGDYYSGTYDKVFYVLGGELTLQNPALPYSTTNPYLITSVTDWLKLAKNISEGVDNNYYVDKYYKLTNSITIPVFDDNNIMSMVGTEEHPFSGHFTGRVGNTYDIYTLTFNYGTNTSPTNEQIIAPFRYTDGATIEYLRVSGAIYTSVGKDAGLIGVNTNTTTVQYVIVDVNLYCKEDLWDEEGGGFAYDGRGIHFSSCAYQGLISSENYIGGFCGNADGTTTFAYCLFNPADGGLYWAENFVWNNSGATIGNTCYYTEGNNQEETEQGTLVYVVYAGHPMPDEIIGKKQTTLYGRDIYKPVNVVITGVNKRYTYTGDDITITPTTVKFDNVNVLNTDNCEWSITPSPVHDIGLYTFKVTAPKQGVTSSDYLGFVTQLVRVVSGTSTAWTQLQAALSGSAKTIELAGDIEAGGEDVCLVVESNREVTINLNGHKIDRGFYNGNNTWSDVVIGGHVLKVKSDATVVINGPGTITGGSNKAASTAEHGENNDGGGIFNMGTLTLNNVTIEGNYCEKKSAGVSRTARGGGIYSGSGSTLIVNNCTITHNEAKGGGGGLFVEKAAVFEMKNTSVQSNNSQDKGGGIRVHADGTKHNDGAKTLVTGALIQNCVIENNEVELHNTESASNGGGIHLDGGTLYLTNCTIKTNRSSKYGGGIYMMGGTINATDCNISYNSSYDRANLFEGYGGGVCILGGTFDMTGGTVYGNSSYISDGGGIFVASGKTLRLSGSVNITRNWKYNDSSLGSTSTTNVYLVNSNGKINIYGTDGSFSESLVGVSKAGITGVFTTGLSNRGTIANFSSDNADYQILPSGNEAQIGQATPVTPPDDGTWTINSATILNTTVGNDVTGIVFEANGCLYVNEGGVINSTTVITNNDPNKLIINGGQVNTTTANVKATIHKEIKYAIISGTPENWYLISSGISDPSITTNTNLITDNGNGYPTYDLYRFNESVTNNLQWENYRAGHADFTTLANGRGYLYRNGDDYTISISGELNSGDVYCPVTCTPTVNTEDNIFKGFNLIGNPYTHDITLLNTTLVDDENASISTNLSGFYRLTANGSTWTAEITSGAEATIETFEGFLVQVPEAAKKVKFSKTARAAAKSNGDNLMFAVANDRFKDVAYALFDDGYGLNKIDHMNDTVPMIYINQNYEDYAIAMMGDENKQFNLNFEAKTMGMYTLTVNPQGNYSYLHLIDKVAEEDIDLLKENEYSFIGSPIDNADRFVVRLNNSESSDNSTFAYQSGNDIVVCGDGELSVFDVMGRLVMQKHVSGVESIATPMTTGVYIMRLNENTQKIVVR